MEPHVFFWPGLVYVFIYIYLVRRAVRAVKSVLKDYEKPGKVIELFGWTESVTSVKLMLDPSFPRADFPKDVKRKISQARFFFFTCPFVFIICITSMIIFSN